MFIDTHIDTLWAMGQQDRTFAEQSEEGHVDLPRAQQADLLAGFFTGYPTESHYVTERMLRDWLEFVENPENQIQRITTFDQLQQLEKERQQTTKVEDRDIGVVLCLEGAAGIDTELNRLYIYYDLGLRSMGLTWNERNQFATGQAQSADRGVTKEGRDLLATMEDLGIIIDVSHLNDQSFWDVIDYTNSPIIASHSNIRELADHNRNLTEEMVTAIADTGGTIGINFYKAFLHDEPDQASVEDVVKMFQGVIDLVGVDHVHIGADLDGATFPDDIGDITDIPTVMEKVQLDISLTDQEMKKIRTENIKRVMKKIWK